MLYQSIQGAAITQLKVRPCTRDLREAYDEEDSQIIEVCGWQNPVRSELKACNCNCLKLKLLQV